MSDKSLLKILRGNMLFRFYEWLRKKKDKGGKCPPVETATNSNT